jgi:hypothetical protein
MRKDWSIFIISVHNVKFSQSLEQLVKHTIPSLLDMDSVEHSKNIYQLSNLWLFLLWLFLKLYQIGQLLFQFFVSKGGTSESYMRKSGFTQSLPPEILKYYGNFMLAAHATPMTTFQNTQKCHSAGGRGPPIFYWNHNICVSFRTLRQPHWDLSNLSNLSCSTGCTHFTPTN